MAYSSHLRAGGGGRGTGAEEELEEIPAAAPALRVELAPAEEVDGFTYPIAGILPSMGGPHGKAICHPKFACLPDALTP